MCLESYKDFVAARRCLFAKKWTMVFCVACQNVYFLAGKTALRSQPKQVYYYTLRQFWKCLEWYYGGLWNEVIVGGRVLKQMQFPFFFFFEFEMILEFLFEVMCFFFNQSKLGKQIFCPKVILIYCIPSTTGLSFTKL